MLHLESRGLHHTTRFSWACAHRTGADLVRRPRFVVQQRARSAPDGKISTWIAIPADVWGAIATGDRIHTSAAPGGHSTRSTRCERPLTHTPHAAHSAAPRARDVLSSYLCACVRARVRAHAGASHDGSAALRRLGSDDLAATATAPRRI